MVPSRNLDPEIRSDTIMTVDNGWKMTLDGSRFVRTSERRYAPIEEEALAMAWALEDKKFFTLGCDNLVIATEQAVTWDRVKKETQADSYPHIYLLLQ